MKEIKCCICGQTIDEAFGNNPEGALGQDNLPIKWGKEDCCCDSCNLLYVIPGRLYVLQNNKK